MSWPTGQLPAEVAAMRDMLQASAYWLAAGGGSSQIHYPDFTQSPSTVFPAALIIREQHMRMPYAAGSSALPSGTLRIELYIQATIDVVEAVAQGIAADLAAATTGLSIRSAETDLAGDISNARQGPIDDGSSASFRVATINVAYGLSV